VPGWPTAPRCFQRSSTSSAVSREPATLCVSSLAVAELQLVQVQAVRADAFQVDGEGDDVVGLARDAGNLDGDGEADAQGLHDGGVVPRLGHAGVVAGVGVEPDLVQAGVLELRDPGGVEGAGRVQVGVELGAVAGLQGAEGFDDAVGHDHRVPSGDAGALGLDEVALVEDPGPVADVHGALVGEHDVAVHLVARHGAVEALLVAQARDEQDQLGALAALDAAQRQDAEVPGSGVLLAQAVLGQRLLAQGGAAKRVGHDGPWGRRDLSVGLPTYGLAVRGSGS
jgi:hypothetical protein